MTIRERIKQFLSTATEPKTFAQIAAGIDAPAPSVRRTISSMEFYREVRYRGGERLNRFELVTE